jgi:imidazole glycerol-phosphate synthase subunit HisH
MIRVIDYGAGNLRSVANTLEAVGAEFEIVSRPGLLDGADKIILPGVGHFGQLIRSLDALGMRQPLLDRVRRGVPFLGICLGLQAMFEGSAEAPDQEGLALFQGEVERFPAHARVPHMGWNEIAPRAGSRLLRDLGPRPYVFFANSYYCPVTPATAARCHYELDFTAALEQDNIFGVQFHPEKSGPVGLRIVRNFVEL